MYRSPGRSYPEPNVSSLCWPARRFIVAASVAALAATIACSDSSAPQQNRTPVIVPVGTEVAGLSLIRAASDAPAIANPTLSFYATKGVDAEAIMWYRPRAGRTDSTMFVRFRVDRRSLLTRPDGSAIADGDSVLITMTLSDPTHLVVDFQPSGLRFSAANPAELKISYLEADKDFNDDGVVDSSDTAFEAALSMWRRELSTSPWAKLSSSLVTSTHEVEATLTGFTSYAIASG